MEHYRKQNRTFFWSFVVRFHLFNVFIGQLKYWNNILITITNEISCLGKSFRYCLYKAEGMS